MPENDDRRPPQDDDSDLIELTRVYGPFEADLIKNFLESHGIASIIRGRMAPGIYPFTVDGLAEFKVLVQKSDLEKARDLIAAMPAPDENGGPEKPA
ncbi:MAG: putative signal transducing protein [Candidatus Aminicenantales bacterium]